RARRRDRPRRARERRRGRRGHARDAARAARRRPLPALVAAREHLRPMQPLRLPSRLPPRPRADARPRRESAGARSLLRPREEDGGEEDEGRRRSRMSARPPDAAARALAATDFERNLCVIAGAGCGKTSLLVERVLFAVLARATPLDRIAAITFTEKA